MTGALFDAPILVDALVGLSAARTAIITVSERYITRLAWAEIMAGARGDEDRVEEFLHHFKVIELNEDIARRAAVLRRQRPAMAMGEALTLACAKLSGRILVTRNIQDFPAELPGIRVPYTL